MRQEFVRPMNNQYQRREPPIQPPPRQTPPIQPPPRQTPPMQAPSPVQSETTPPRNSAIPPQGQQFQPPPEPDSSEKGSNQEHPESQNGAFRALRGSLSATATTSQWHGPWQPNSLVNYHVTPTTSGGCLQGDVDQVWRDHQNRLWYEISIQNLSEETTNYEIIASYLNSPINREELNQKNMTGSGNTLPNELEESQKENQKRKTINSQLMSYPTVFAVPFIVLSIIFIIYSINIISGFIYGIVGAIATAIGIGILFYGSNRVDNRHRG